MEKDVTAIYEHVTNNHTLEHVVHFYHGNDRVNSTYFTTRQLEALHNLLSGLKLLAPAPQPPDIVLPPKDRHGCFTAFMETGKALQIVWELANQSALSYEIAAESTDLAADYDTQMLALATVQDFITNNFEQEG